jgi:hypothetical protein
MKFTPKYVKSIAEYPQNEAKLKAKALFNAGMKRKCKIMA